MVSALQWSLRTGAVDGFGICVLLAGARVRVIRIRCGCLRLLAVHTFTCRRFGRRAF